MRQVNSAMMVKVVVGLVAVLGAATSCSESDVASASRAGGGPAFGGFEPPGDPSAATGGTPSNSGAPLPPQEVENPLQVERPHAGDKFVYVPNPASDTVAIIDAGTLAIRTVEVGDEPRHLETVGGKDVAIVLNVKSDDAHILRTEVSGETKSTRLEVLPGSNRIEVAPDGKHAVTFFDAAQGTPGSTGSFQDVNVIVIGETPAEDRSVGLSVGFRPSRVFFHSASSHAYVVTEDGVSVIDFSLLGQGDGIARTIPIAPREQAKALDVSVTGDGQFALGRIPGQSTVRLVNLVSGDIQLLELQALSSSPPNAGGAGGVGSEPGEPLEITDVDVARDGSFALAVARNTSTVFKIPLPAGFSDPSVVQQMPVSGELIGSAELTPDGKLAVLYSTALATERISLLDLETGDFRPQDLRKSSRGLAISSDSRIALVVHAKVDGSPAEPGIDQDLVIDRSFGYSLVRLDTGFAKLQLTEADIGPFDTTSDNSALFVLFNSAAVRQVHRVGLDNFGVTRIDLGSPPVSLGSVPNIQKVFVGQEHPDGRITFVDYAAKSVESVTGFEKNSRIRE